MSGRQLTPYQPGSATACQQGCRGHEISQHRLYAQLSSPDRQPCSCGQEYSLVLLLCASILLFAKRQQLPPRDPMFGNSSATALFRVCCVVVQSLVGGQSSNSQTWQPLSFLSATPHPMDSFWVVNHSLEEFGDRDSAGLCMTIDMSLHLNIQYALKLKFVYYKFMSWSQTC